MSVHAIIKTTTNGPGLRGRAEARARGFQRMFSGMFQGVVKSSVTFPVDFRRILQRCVQMSYHLCAVWRAIACPDRGMKTCQAWIRAGCRRASSRHTSSPPRALPFSRASLYSLGRIVSHHCRKTLLGTHTQFAIVRVTRNDAAIHI